MGVVTQAPWETKAGPYPATREEGHYHIGCDLAPCALSSASVAKWAPQAAHANPGEAAGDPPEPPICIAPCCLRAASPGNVAPHIGHRNSLAIVLPDTLTLRREMVLRSNGLRHTRSSQGPGAMSEGMLRSGYRR